MIVVYVRLLNIGNVKTMADMLKVSLFTYIIFINYKWIYVNFAICIFFYTYDKSYSTNYNVLLDKTFMIFHWPFFFITLKTIFF